MTTRERKRVAVLISGRGSNMAALIEAASMREFPATIELVVSDKPDAAGLAIAARAGIATQVLKRSDFPSKQAHDAAIDAALDAAGTEIVCLAGYMRLLTQEFVAKWQGRMINIHPALLPSFKGLDTHARALEAGVRLHGCTAHFVSFDMDAGPIIAQAAVPVLGGDTPDTLAARVLRAEHRIYPRSLALVASGRVWMEDGRCRIQGMADGPAEDIMISPLGDAAAPAGDIRHLAGLTP